MSEVLREIAKAKREIAKAIRDERVNVLDVGGQAFSLVTGSKMRWPEAMHYAPQWPSNEAADRAADLYDAQADQIEQTLVADTN